MFLIDSEGMGVRGDSFDFMTTTPPAVISKVILWIYAGTFDTAEILYQINDYLNGLNNIVLQDYAHLNGSKQQCTEQLYGYFIVVINKMVGDTSDEDMLRDLMTPEPDRNDGYEERNEIRDKLRQCFEGVDVAGLPTLTINSGDKIDYELLDDYPRFQTGLQKMTNSIMQTSCKPRQVTVAGMSRDLMANNSVSIIGTVIEESNRGKIDLTGFDSFWTYVQQDVESRLLLVEEKLSIFDPNCVPSKSYVKGYQCTNCVCSLRNESIARELERVDEILELATIQALGFFDVDLQPYVTTFMEEMVNPWTFENSCYSVTSVLKPQYYQQHGEDSVEICDISQMESQLISPGQSVTVKCDVLLICGRTNYDANDVTLETDALFIDSDSTITNTKPAKAPNGSNGKVPGERGSDAQNGKNAPLMQIYGNYLLQDSVKTLRIISYGGDGGDGGNGTLYIESIAIIKSV